MLDASSPSPRSRGEGRGEGQPQTAAQASAPHPNPLGTGTVWRGSAFHHDAWARVADDAELPEGPAVISKDRWLAERERLAQRSAPLGLVIAAGESIDDLAVDLPRFALIALEVPKFSDGRAYSTARLLREKYGFTGELRAVGNVLSDQIPLMRRVGFDAFEVTHAPTRRTLIEGRIPEVALHYQPAVAGAAEAVGPRPWLRRSR